MVYSVQFDSVPRQCFYIWLSCGQLVGVRYISHPSILKFETPAEEASVMAEACKKRSCKAKTVAMLS